MGRFKLDKTIDSCSSCSNVLVWFGSNILVCYMVMVIGNRGLFWFLFSAIARRNLMESTMLLNLVYGGRRKTFGGWNSYE